MRTDYCIYLRKSRADLELESQGGGDTLVRHRRHLLDYAANHHLTVTKIYEEVVSGETIAARPQMQQLLLDVDQGLWAGVLVMEVERLARGDTIDQGIVAQSFKYSDTLIVTPTKTYDPNNEFDEEYFEFGLFMSRREYKTINRRLQRGRMASIKEGKFVGNKPPYGYRRVKIPHDKGFTLEPVPEQAQWVQKIFEWYTTPQDYPAGKPAHLLGCTAIANRLNDLGIPSATGSVWTSPVISAMLRNPVYIGMVRWGARAGKKKIENGVVVVTRPRDLESATVVPGLHPALISEDLFNQAQARLIHPSRPGPKEYALKNPLSGLIICSCCGHAMVRRPYQSGRQESLICAYNACHGTVASDLRDVESLLLQSISSWHENLKLQVQQQRPVDPTPHEAAIASIEKELRQLAAQESKAYDLVEQGIYSTDIFLQRTKTISERRAALNEQLDKARQDLQAVQDNASARSELIPKVQRVLDTYWQSDNAARNVMLKEILDKVVYTKTIGGRWAKTTDLRLELYPKLPTSSNTSGKR